jgi:hypothetical protein
MRLVAGSTPVTVKRRTMSQSTKLRTSLLKIIFRKKASISLLFQSTKIDVLCGEHKEE